MYYPYFITYMSAGFGISLLVLFWAIRNGQFREQQRARFLPLQDEPDAAPAASSRASRYEIYGLFFLAVAGLGASAAVLIFALITHR